MAAPTHGSQIAEAFSADASIGFVMHLCRASATLPTFVVCTLHNRPTLKKQMNKNLCFFGCNSALAVINTDDTPCYF